MEYLSMSEPAFNAVFCAHLRHVPQQIFSQMQDDARPLSEEEQDDRDKIANLLLSGTWEGRELAYQLLSSAPQLVRHLESEILHGVVGQDWYEEEEVPFGAHAGKKIQELERDELVDLFFIAKRLYEVYGRTFFVDNIYACISRREHLFIMTFDGMAREYEFFGMQLDPLYCFAKQFASTYFCLTYSFFQLPPHVLGLNCGNIPDEILAEYSKGKIPEGCGTGDTISISANWFDVCNERIEPYGGNSAKVFVIFDKNEVLKEAARRNLTLPKYYGFRF
jgi:hypothetical protein